MDTPVNQQFPQIAKDRLKALKGNASAHPEVGLLAAFSENALAGAERESLLAHLTICADCRDVVALSQPPVEETTPTFAAKPAASTFGWRWVRFGAAAAGVAVMTGALVLMHQPEGGRI